MGASKLGPELTQFKEFIVFLDAQMRGEQLGAHEKIRTVHNSFARPEPFHFDKSAASSDDEAFHFITYCPFKSGLYELDGLQKGPILLEASGVTDDNWLTKVKGHAQGRMSQYAQSEIRFALLGITADPRMALQQEKDTLEASGGSQDRINDINERLAAEEAKRKQWAEANIRRRHNYVPLIFNLLKILAREGKLTGLLNDAIQLKKE